MALIAMSVFIMKPYMQPVSRLELKNNYKLNAELCVNINRMTVFQAPKVYIVVQSILNTQVLHTLIVRTVRARCLLITYEYIKK
jgi:hypothetical protein